MAEGVESRKNDRKQMFDVPLPMRRAQRELAPSAEGTEGEVPAPLPVATNNTMKFALLSKKGNRQQASCLRCVEDCGQILIYSRV